MKIKTTVATTVVTKGAQPTSCVNYGHAICDDRCANMEEIKAMATECYNATMDFARANSIDVREVIYSVHNEVFAEQQQPEDAPVKATDEPKPIKFREWL